MFPNPPPAVVSAVRHLLSVAPDRWTTLDPDQLSEPEHQVLLRLHAFRLIERRATLVSTSPAAPGVIRGFSQASGLPPIPFEGSHNLIGAWTVVWEDARREWVARHPTTPFPIVVRGEDWQWRITAEGLEARGHIAHDLDGVLTVLFGQSLHGREGITGYFRVTDLRVEEVAHRPITQNPTAVSVANWSEGAAAVAAALSEQMNRKVPSETTGRPRGNRPLEATDAAKLNVYRMIHAANAAFEQGGGSRKGRPARLLSHLTNAAEHKQLRESIDAAGLMLTEDLIKKAVDAMNKKVNKPTKRSQK